VNLVVDCSALASRVAAASLDAVLLTADRRLAGPTALPCAIEVFG